MKAQHPFDLLREQQGILFPALAKHALCTLIGLLALVLWVLYAVAWAVGFLWEFFTDPLLKVNLIEGVLELFHRLPPSVDLEHTPIVAPVYAYLQRALDDTTWEVLGSEQDKDITAPWTDDMEHTEPETHPTFYEVENDRTDEQLAADKALLDELGISTTDDE